MSEIYAFHLGRAPGLSRAELGSFFREKEIIDQNEETLVVELPQGHAALRACLPPACPSGRVGKAEQAGKVDKAGQAWPPAPPPHLPLEQVFLNRLGGTIKISRVFTSLPAKDQAAETIAAHLSRKFQNLNKKFNFGISVFPPDEISLKNLLKKVKKIIKSEGVRSRFINKNFQNLSSVQVKKGGLLKEDGVEINLIRGQIQGQIPGRIPEQIPGRITGQIPGQKTWYLSETIALQDFESYSKRDYDKPFRDPKSGMLPPKLAQIMINLAIPNILTSTPFPGEKLFQKNHPPLLYDPFCGTGTILMEGLLMGFPVQGSDNNPAAALGCQKNLNWLRQNFPINPHLKSRVFLKDARKISPADLLSLKPPANRLFLVTEPYLGPPLVRFPSPSDFQKMQTELKNLYFSFFQNLAPLVPKGTPIVIAFPFWRQKNRRFFLENLFEKIEKLGYSRPAFKEPLLFERPDQLVGRQIIKFLKN